MSGIEDNTTRQTYIYVTEIPVLAMPTPRRVPRSKRGALVHSRLHGFLVAYDKKYVGIQLPTPMHGPEKVSMKNCVKFGKAMTTHEHQILECSHFQNEILERPHIESNEINYRQVYLLKEYFLEGGGMTIYRWRRSDLMISGTWDLIDDHHLEKYLEMSAESTKPNTGRHQ